MKKYTLAMAVIILMAGCATKPENISPAYVSELTYASLTCEQLRQEQDRLVNALSLAADAQRKARSGDTVGVIFLGLPVSSLSGSNVATEIARLKGELEAIRRAARTAGCSLPDVGDPTKLVNPNAKPRAAASRRAHHFW